MKDSTIPFRGKVSFISKGDSLFARAVYRKDGKKKQMWRKVTGTKKDARDSVIEAIEKALEEKEEKKEMSFSDLAKYYNEKHAIPARFVNDVKVEGKKSWKFIRFDVGQLKDFYGDLPIKELTRDRIQEFRIYKLDQPVRKIDKETGLAYNAPRSLAAVNHQLRTLRAMLNVALSNDWIDKLPNFKGLISEASEERREVIPTQEEFDRILTATQLRPRLYHIKAFALLMADCGGRPIEQFNLRWGDLDLVADTVLFTSDKGKRRLKRVVGLTVRAKEALMELPKLNEFVFGGIKSIKTAWKSIQKEAKVDYTPYHLRRLFASRLDELGLSEITKMLLMGHSSPKMTARYVTIMPETLKAVANLLDANPYSAQEEIISENN